MEIFVAVINDRHVDLYIELFTNFDDAVKWVSDWLDNHADEDEISKEYYSGFEFYADYGVEGDHVFVVRRKLDNKVKVK